MAYTNIDDPSAFFTTTLYTGTGANQDVVNDAHSGNFKPDFLWIKNRTNGSYGPHYYDSTRGAKKGFYSDAGYGDDAEFTDGGQSTVQSFNTNGFRGGSSTNIYNIFWINGLNTGYVAWQWKSNGGTTASNTSGTINSTVQVNQDAGFSIGTYTGNGSTADQNVGHGLGVRPGCVIVKNRTADANWVVYIDGLDVNHCLELNTTDGQSDSTAGRVLATTAGSYGTSSIFTLRVGGSSVVQTNTNNSNYVFYAWAERQGYSKFGKYVGNGNADGPFVYTGFKPALIIMKEYSSAGGNWVILDNKRDTHNVTKHRLFPNLVNADNTSRNYVDLLSNGFKLRDTDADHNQSGQSMVYMAFAENPFVTSTGIPTTAR